MNLWSMTAYLNISLVQILLINCALTADETLVPGQPTSVRTTTSSDSAIVSWLPPDDNTLVRSYMIGYGEGVPDVNRIYVSGFERKATIRNLKPLTHYVISVRALNKLGQGLVVYDLVFTPEAPDETLVPGQPTSVRTTTSSDSAIVSWLPPDDNTFVRSYVIGYGEGVPDVNQIYVSGFERKATIRKLKPSTHYVISVRALNKLGQGLVVYDLVFTPEAPDTNECRIENGGCQHRCSDTIRSFMCYCDHGFQAINSTHCEDIDECILKYDGCEVNCTNTPGSFFCSCKDGYSLNNDMKTCSDFDECMTGVHECTQYCINLLGSYRCSCKEGFTLNSDGTTCDEFPWSTSASTAAALFGIVAVLTISVASILGYTYYKLRQHFAANRLAAGGSSTHDDNRYNSLTEVHLQLMSARANRVETNQYVVSVEPGDGYVQLDTEQEPVYVNSAGHTYEALREN